MRYAILLSVLISAAGCQPKTEAVPPQPAPAPPAPAAVATTPAAPGEIGVAECDDYLRKWEACLSSKVTGAAHDQVKVALDATRDGWKRAAETPEGKAGLAAACKDAADLARSQVTAYGCTW
jgi:hypothetical protein